MTGGQNQQPRVVGQERQADAALFLDPADEDVARLEVQGRRAPGGQSQPLALVCGDVADMFAHDAGVFEVVMRNDEGIEAFDFMRLDGPHGEVFQDVLFVRRGLPMPDRIFLHARERKESQTTCPVQSIIPPHRNDFPP